MYCLHLKAHVELKGFKLHLIFSVASRSQSKARGPMKAQVEDLRKQLKAKSRIIQSLKEEIKTPLFQSAQKKNEVRQNPFSPVLFD